MTRHRRGIDLNQDTTLSTRKENHNLTTPDDIGSRDYYKLNRDASILQARKIDAAIPVHQKVAGSGLPIADKRAIDSLAQREGSPGMLDPLTRGMCGELALKCGLLQNLGLKACTGTTYVDRKTNRVMGKRDPCPHRHEHMPISRGTFIQAAFKR